MSVLVLRLAAPLQAWPAASRRKARDTERAPTYSALVGLVRAAQGLARLQSGQHPEAPLVAAVRVDRPGRVIRDFHTVNPVGYSTFERAISANDQRKIKSLETASGAPVDRSVISTRHYVADATYTAFIDDPTGTIAAGFSRPGFALSAGRKSCPFSDPIVLGSTPGDIEDLATRLPVVSDAPQTLDVHLFQPPQHLSVARTSELWDSPAGEVAQEYRLRRRFICSVKPPAVPQVWHQVDFLREASRDPVPQ